VTNHPTLHHLALGAHDVELVATFYRDALGLPEVRRHHDGSGHLRSIWLDLGSALLMVEQTDAPLVEVERIGAGPFLIAVRVPREMHGDWEARLGAHGCHIESRTDHTSYTRDPEGNRVAISHYGD
jgi:glyoxylase I family protein